MQEKKEDFSVFFQKFKTLMRIIKKIDEIQKFFQKHIAFLYNICYNNRKWVNLSHCIFYLRGFYA